MSKVFGCVTKANLKLVDILKMSERFRAKLYCKMSELFRSLLLAFRLSARKLKK